MQAVAEELAVLPTSPSELRRNKEDKLLKVVRGLSGRLVQSKEAAAKADRGFDPILEGFVDVADTVFKAGMAIRDVELHWARLPDGLQIKTQEGPVARAWRAKQASVGSFFGLEPATAAPPPAAAAPDAEPSSVKPPEDKADQHSVFATRLPDINGKPVPKTTPLAPPAGVQGKDVAPPGTDGGGDKPRLVPSTGNKTRDDVIDVLSYGLSQATTPMQAAVDIEAVLKLRYCPDVDEPNDEYLKILRRIWDAVAFEVRPF